MGYSRITGSMYLIVALTNCAALTVMPNTCYADSSPASNSSTIPTATNDVKAGDWIMWQAPLDVLTKVTDMAAQSVGAATAPTGDDIAAAAVAVQASISAQLPADATAAAAATATKDDKNKQQADLDALVLATAAAKKAGSPGKASNNGAVVVAAALQVKVDAQTALDAAVKQANQAMQQSVNDLATLSSAKTQTEALKGAADASAQKAASALAAESAATVYRDAASAAYDKATAKAVSVSPATFCAPPRSRFYVTNVTAASSSKSGTANAANGAQAATGGSAATTNAATVEGYYPSQFLLFHLRSIKEYPPPRSGGSLTPPTTVKSPCGEGTTLPSYNAPYQFQATDTTIGAYYREGFTWGAMVIPYKFYVKDKTFKGNPSTVAFIGYEGWFPGVSLAGVMALGPGIAQSASSSSAAAASTKSTSTTTGVTYTAATGLIATFSGVIKAGLLVGWDWQGSGNNFQYEGKTWIALSVGAGF